MNDAVFGWQFLNGCNPNTIRRCEELPTNFPVTEDLVKGFLDGGKSLNDEIKVVVILFFLLTTLAVCFFLIDG